MIKNLSQLKKKIERGSRIKVIDHCRQECIGQRRKVTLANTQGFYSTLIDEPENKTNQSNGGKGPVLWWSKAPFWSFENGVCSLYSSDSRQTKEYLIISFEVEEVAS